VLGVASGDLYPWATTTTSLAKANSKGAPRPARAGSFIVDSTTNPNPEVLANPADDVTFGPGMPVFIRPVFTPPKLP
jgi:hypothetical protein